MCACYRTKPWGNSVLSRSTIESDWPQDAVCTNRAVLFCLSYAACLLKETHNQKDLKSGYDQNPAPWVGCKSWSSSPLDQHRHGFQMAMGPLAWLPGSYLINAALNYWARWSLKILDIRLPNHKGKPVSKEQSILEPFNRGEATFLADLKNQSHGILHNWRLP